MMYLHMDLAEKKKCTSSAPVNILGEADSDRIMPSAIASDAGMELTRRRSRQQDAWLN
jgi:hypothetical protein